MNRSGVIYDRAVILAFAGLFICVIGLGGLLFGPHAPSPRHEVRVEPGAKVGLRAEALRVVMP